jgi:hypothetical protein
VEPSQAELFPTDVTAVDVDVEGDVGTDVEGAVTT